MGNNGFGGRGEFNPLNPEGERTQAGSFVEAALLTPILVGAGLAIAGIEAARGGYWKAKHRLQSLNGLAIMSALGAESWRAAPQQLDVNPTEPITPLPEEQS